MRRLKFVLVFVAMVLVLAVAVPHIAAQTRSEAGVRWLTYIDPRYGFSIEYASDWQITPRDDRGISGTVGFSSPDGLAKVEVGLYPAERTGNTPLEEWTVRYDAVTAAFESTDIQIESEQAILAGEQSALQREGVSSLTEFKYVNIPRGNTVWFIWTNSDDARAAIYDHMVTSFKFGRRTPQALRDAYGLSFQPLRLDEMPEIPMGQALPESSGFVALGSDPAGFRLPFIGKRYISCGPGCSDLHKNQSSEAIDYAMPTGTPLIASNSGWIAGWGWSNAGWGNYLKIARSDGSYSWYAHLSSYRPNLWNGQYVQSGCLQAYSGCTGTCYGPHVHFEVRSSNDQSVWIRTLPTTTWYSGNPESPCQPGDQNDGEATGPTSSCYP